MSGSGLAAVHAAATVSTALTPPAAPVAPTLPAPAAAAPATTVADLVSAYPDLCTALRVEGATAERTRIMGIGALADAGNAALIAEMQADGKTTPADAALRILGAQKEARGQQLQAIKDVETVTSAVRPAVTSSAAPTVEQASTPEGWKAQWAASAALQAEFYSAESYVSYQQGVASGRIKRLESRKTA